MTLATRVPIGKAPERRTTQPSVLIAIPGPYPMVWDGITTESRLQEMGQAASDYEVNMVYIEDMISPDRNMEDWHYDPKGRRTHDPDKGEGHPGDGMNKMRNWAVQQTLELGYDHLFLVENDAWVKPDTLIRLLRSPYGITMPNMYYVPFPPMGRTCWGPQPKKGGHTGYWPLRWSVFTAAFYNRKALELVQPFFGDYVDEGSEFERWRDYGLSAYMDLDTWIDVLRCPSGHSGYQDIPMNGHYRNVGGKLSEEICPGRMRSVWANFMLDVWVCDQEDFCDHYVILRLMDQRWPDGALKKGG